MVATRAKVNKDTVTYWLPDPADIVRLMHLLEIYGYTDEQMAREEASQDGECNSVFEITIRKREIGIPRVWRDEVNWIENLHDGFWQA